MRRKLSLKRLIAPCYRKSMGRWLSMLALALACSAAYAQIARPLPLEGKLGELIGGQNAFPLLQIDNAQARLAPGGLIFDQNNRTIVHGQLPERATVLYVLNAGGEVSRIYILRPEELALVKQRPAAK